MNYVLISVALAALLPVATAQAQQGEPFPDDDWDQIARLVPDGPPDTGKCGFGWDIDIKGDLAVASSPWVWGPAHPDFSDLPQDHRPNTGAVWVFEKLDGTWQQTAILRSPYPWEEGRFGTSCVISGEQIIVGAPGENVDSPRDAACATVEDGWLPEYGRLYVFEKTGAEWTVSQTLEAPVLDQTTFCGPDFPGFYHQFVGLGHSLAAGGDTLVVGCPDAWSWVESIDNWLQTGLLYVYRRFDSTWTLVQTVDLGTQRTEVGRLGFSVAVSQDGEFILSGGGDAWVDLNNDDLFDSSESDVGMAYIFKQDAKFGSYEHIQTLTRNDVGPDLAIREGYFGYDVAITSIPNPDEQTIEHHAFISAPGAWVPVEEPPGTFAPAAGVVDQFVFQPDFGDFTFQDTLENPIPFAFDYFGEKIDLGEDRLLVAAWGADRDLNGDGQVTVDVGQSYMFYPDPVKTTEPATPHVPWRTRWTATPPDGVDSAYFGWPAVTDGNSIFLAATNADGCIGAAYIYEHNTGFPDLDGDELRDDWELRGVPWSNETTGESGRYPLRVCNEGWSSDSDQDAFPFADPWFRDLFIEIDTADLAFQNQESWRVARQSFEDSPLMNPSGFTGVRLHLTCPAGIEEVPLSLDAHPNSGPITEGYYNENFGSQTDRDHPTSSEQIIAAKAKAFRWAYIVDTDTDASYAGFAAAPGNFIVLNGPYHATAEAFWAAEVIVHELGHSLGLNHGGTDEINFKPNYISVMNYNYSTISYRYFGTMILVPEFSAETVQALDETNLDETAGIGSGRWADTNFMVPIPVDRDIIGGDENWHWVPASGPVDWNRNGTMFDIEFAQDLNYTGAIDSLNDILQGGGLPSPGQQLVAPNDWAFPFRWAPVPFSQQRTRGDGPVGDEDYTVELLNYMRTQVPPPPIPCNAADLAEPHNLLDLGDINAFVSGFVGQDPIADLDGNGLNDLTDINIFVTSFVAGCP